MRYAIFPLGGYGNRFRKSEFHEPKPFIEIFGKTQMEWALLSCMTNYPNVQVIISSRSGLKEHCQNFAKIAIEKLGIQITILDIGESTDGAAHTVALTLDQLNLNNNQFDFIVLDNDVSIKLKNRNCFTSCSAGLVTAYSIDPKHSYVICDSENRVIRIAEKIVISKKGVVGNYYFNSNFQYLEHYRKLSVEDGEKYISSVLKSYLLSGLKVISEESISIASYGNPRDILSLTKDSFTFLWE